MRVKKNLRRALVTGVSGQDGAYLCKLLLAKGYIVFGTTRSLKDFNYHALSSLGILDDITKIEMCPTNYDDVFSTISLISPDEVYNLSGQSSVGTSFHKPVETICSHVNSCLNLLESIRKFDKKIRFYNAGSGEVFGETNGQPASEDTSLNPVSPYGLAKSQAAKLVSFYKGVYGLHACTGFLFNHESPLRPEGYVTQKIISAACRIGAGSQEKLVLGNIDISRDWGYAAEYVEAMWKMLQLETPEDIIIATGTSHTLRSFLNYAFTYFDLDWKKFVEIDESLVRKSEIMIGAANPSKAADLLNWEAKTKLGNLIDLMITEKLNIEEEY